ncbi:MAG: 23S rRNA (uracil(1939)-C(5))-methyltransferase RlmD [Calditrichaeota bacterium]|nr:MAG: 23S rRNA (uracil(1939)-C(5))-methyltransferase RlmD [Calditrichota bacterium]
MKKGTELELEIESLAFGAEGVARHEGVVIFVRGGLPGQRIRARILRKRKGLHSGQILEILRPSPDQIEPHCSHFGECGGCAIQNYDYQAQLAQKRQQVFDTLSRLGKFTDINIPPVMPSPDVFFYRNKMEFTFSRLRWFSKREFENPGLSLRKDFALGMNVKGFYNKTLQIENCVLQSEFTNNVCRIASQFCLDSKLRPYTTIDHTGFWRFLVVREGKNTGESLVNLVTAEGGEAGRREVDRLGEKLREELPQLTTVVHSINKTKAQVAIGDAYRIVHGPGYIYDCLGKFNYRISANSFFQTNTRGAEKLYEQVEKYADLTGNETVCDFYCGAGSIGIYLSKKAKKVVGVEIIPQAIEDAKSNAELNNVKNCEFYCGDLKDTLLQQKQLFSDAAPDVVILDPPRVGLHHKVVAEVIALKPKRIVYVSCNPATFARDARIFCENGYVLSRTQPVDMFPHTAHIELVNRFDLVDQN